MSEMYIPSLDVESGEVEERLVTPEEKETISSWYADAAEDENARAAVDSVQSSLRNKAQQAVGQLTAAADALDANTATAAQQRAALALVARTQARVIRLLLGLYDSDV